MKFLMEPEFGFKWNFYGPYYDGSIFPVFCRLLNPNWGSSKMLINKIKPISDSCLLGFTCGRKGACDFVGWLKKGWKCYEGDDIRTWASRVSCHWLTRILDPPHHHESSYSPLPQLPITYSQTTLTHIKSISLISYIVTFKSIHSLS